jgi:hypothetical protein
MTTQLSPSYAGLPPPSTHDLIDGGRVVGWIADKTVGFRGFANETEAAHAAWTAYRTLTRRLARRYGTRPIPIEREPVPLTVRDDDNAIIAGGQRVGTLVRPGPESPSGPDSYGFAIHIPEATTELTLRAKAYFMYLTLRKSGTRWALWQRPARREDTPVDLVAGG